MLPMATAVLQLLARAGVYAADGAVQWWLIDLDSPSRRLVSASTAACVVRDAIL